MIRAPRNGCTTFGSHRFEANVFAEGICKKTDSIRCGTF